MKIHQVVKILQSKIKMSSIASIKTAQIGNHFEPKFALSRLNARIKKVLIPELLPNKTKQITSLYY